MGEAKVANDISSGIDAFHIGFIIPISLQPTLGICLDLNTLRQQWAHAYRNERNLRFKSFIRLAAHCYLDPAIYHFRFFDFCSRQ